MIKKLFLILWLSIFLSIPAWAGTTTTNGFLYLPSLGASGIDEKNLFDGGLNRVDTRLGKEIWVGDPNYGTTLSTAVTTVQRMLVNCGFERNYIAVQ